ncbi:MAG: DUF6438 domain-containing protein [Bacteroidota bacterium]|nr:DUF6438 domain-containing protein [Bacteroidota bacterium]
MQPLYSFCFVLTLILLTGCSTVKQKRGAPSETATAYPYVFKYDRGPCFGQCPVYTFYLLSDHSGIVQSKSNLTAQPGWYLAPLDQEAAAEILELIEPETFWTPHLDEQPEIADLPSSSLSYFHQKGLRTIRIQSRTNTDLENVFGKIGHLVSEGRWELTEIRPIDIPGPLMTDVIVQLKAGIDVDMWMKKFERFGIQLKRKLTPNQQYYLVTKDPELGDANDFLQYIKRDEDVVNAQWDEHVKSRE